MADLSTLIEGVLIPTSCLDGKSFPIDQDELYCLVDVEICGQYITRCARHNESKPKTAGAIDGKNKMLIPGFFNAHTHSSEMWTRGQIAQFPLELWLEKLCETPLTPEMLYYSALGTGVETLLSGGTAVLDHVVLIPGQEEASAEAVVRAYRECGIRAFVAPLVSDLPFGEDIPKTKVGTDEPIDDPPTIRPAEETVVGETDRIVNFMNWLVEKHHCPNDALHIGVGPTGLQLCTDSLFKRLAQISDKHNLLRHTHFLETPCQKQLAYENFKPATGGQHLLDIGFLDKRTTCAHSVWLVDEDMDAMAKANATAVHNPLSNLRLGSGISPVVKLRKKGVNVTFGCDGSASNDSQDLLEAVKMGTILHTIEFEDYREWPTPHQSLVMATRGGAHAMNMVGEVGVIGLGKIADVVLYDLTDLSLLPFTDPVGMLVLGRPNRGTITDVWVNGRQVVSGGVPTGTDVDRLRKYFVDRSKIQMRRVDIPPTAREIQYRKATRLPL